MSDKTNAFHLSAYAKSIKNNIKNNTSDTVCYYIVKLVEGAKNYSSNNKKININTCTVEDLININGLGETKAKNIIEYRNSNGYFTSLEDLLNVDGIGNKTLEKIKEFIGYDESRVWKKG